MSEINRPALLNRILLGTAGLLLIVAGVALIAAHDGRLPRVDADSTLVPGDEAPPTWVFWAVLAGAVVLGLLCLRWLLAQLFRMPKSRTWRTRGAERAGTTFLESATAAAPVATDIEAYDDVRSASAWLSGTRAAPQLHLVVTAQPSADIPALRRRILDHAVARMRQALEVEVIPVTLELRFEQDRRPARVQ
ncbi:alkaline shock response membrane anchor protein AmaP [Nocardia sp. NPDC005366]|uniref:alkaline shock response membrane anchor protein AmaP n=1 Tax=Nocardia sp. NPDC005366 TaxID=3156878 RepID=UPI00339E666B